MSKAAKFIGAARSTVFSWRADDEEFTKAWDDAMEAGIDRLEDEAYRRAHDGVTRTRFYKDQPLDQVTEYSDALLTFMLKGKRAGTFNTERHEHTGPGGGAIDHRITVEFVSVKASKK